jgi:hypothetical protein
MSAIDRIIEKIFGQKMVRCTERFKLVNANVMCNHKQLFATAQLESLQGEEISGASIYMVPSGVDLDDPRFSGGSLGPAMASDTTFKLPLTLGTTLSPFEMKETMKIHIIVAISSPGTDEMCFLDAEASVNPHY